MAHTEVVSYNKLNLFKTLQDKKNSSTFVAQEANKSLMTDAERTKLNGIATNANNYSLPTASASTKGGVKIGTGLSMSGESIQAAAATSSALGGVKIPANGGISNTSGSISLAAATSGTIGGVKIASDGGISVSSGTIGVPVMTASSATVAGTKGLVPAPAAGKDATYFLNSQGQWVIPHDTTYNNFTSASSTNAGTSGLVPAPTVGTNNTYYLNAAGKWTIPYSVFSVGTNGLVPGPSSSNTSTYLCSNGSWATPTNTTYPAASGSTAGLMSAAHYTKLEGIATNANNYSLPNATTSTKGGIIVGSGLVANGATVSVAAASTGTIGGIKLGSSGFLRYDGTWATPTNTTYPTASSSTNGLMSASDKSKLDGITAALQYKGTVESYSKLPTTGLVIGYVYNITNAGGTDANGVAIKAGDNVAYNGSGWDVLSGTVDLSNYVTKDGSKVLSTNDFTTAYKNKLDGIDTNANNYSLPTASTSTKGGIKVGTGLAMSSETLTLAAASAGTIGGVKIGTGISTGAGGVISIPSATTVSAGLMTTDQVTKLNGIATNANNYSLPNATTSTKGGIIVGSGLVANGATVSVAAASTGTIGGIKLGSSGFLKYDGTWATPTNTTYPAMTGASSSAAGATGLVPAPAAGKQTSFLRGDGTWVIPTNTTYSVFTSSNCTINGTLVPSIAANTSGKYLQSNGTWATPTNTTYPSASGSTAGLMSAAHYTKLEGIATNANNYSLPTASASTKGGIKVGTGLTISSDTLSLASRALQVSLNSTAASTFNGSTDVKNIGVQGILPISNGGTGTSSGLPITNVLAAGSTSGNIDAITAFRIGSTASNKTFNIPASAIKIEYSRDSGATWIDYGLPDSQKKDLFSETRGTNVFLGKATTKADNNVKNMLRITINPGDRYVSVNMFYLWGSTNGNAWYAKLEYQKYKDHDTEIWTTNFENKQMSGWSGNNVVYFGQVQGFNRSSSQSENLYALRFTFHQTSINANYPSASLSDIRCYGLNVWTPSSNMVAHNRIYKWDTDLNTTFPASITASGFNGTATQAVQLNTARALQVSLSSTSAPTFNGSADVKNIGVTGILPVAHGGTGKNSFDSALATESASGFMSAKDKTRLNHLFHQTSTAYAVGERISVPEIPSYYYLECKTAGTTGSTAPNFASL